MARAIVDTNAGEDAVHAALVRRFGADAVARRRLDVGDVEHTGCRQCWKVCRMT